MATVVISPDASDEMERLPKLIHTRVVKLLERLEHWPNVSGAKAMRGNLSGKYRLRTGDYRLLFHLIGETVVVEKIGHRKDFYED